jgi:hypothetical protein
VAAGIIVMDRMGGIGVEHSTEFMPHAYFVEDDSEITARMKAEPCARTSADPLRGDPLADADPPCLLCQETRRQ